VAHNLKGGNFFSQALSRAGGKGDTKPGKHKRELGRENSSPMGGGQPERKAAVTKGGGTKRGEGQGFLQDKDGGNS